MRRRDFLRVSTLAVGALAFPGCKSPSGPRPNFVFFLVDDLGWKDVGCYGSRFYETPNIDRLAAEGMRFTQAYAASPVCSPTRASIMTGKHPARLHITDWIGAPRHRKALLSADYIHQMPLEEVTIAEALKEAGYATGFFGKWHLGAEGFYPQNQGFDVNVGGCEIGHPGSYFCPYRREKEPYFQVPGIDDCQEGEYLTDRLTDEALKFLEANRNGPFLLYLSHYAVHTPLMAKEKDIARYEQKLSKMPPEEGPDFVPERNSFTKLKQDDPTYAAMVHSVDESLGRVLDKLEELGLADKTVVIFMSDNGGLSTLLRKWAPTANTPLRAGKGWLYEGGIREPMIIKWPGVTQPGSVCEEPVISMDFYPTMLEMAGLRPRPEQHIDGVSLVPILRGEKEHLRERALFWHYPHYHGSGSIPSSAIRVGDWKLIEFYEERKIELYNLREDIGERQDLSAERPEKAKELRRLLHLLLRSVDAWMPEEAGTKRS